MQSGEPPDDRELPDFIKVIHEKIRVFFIALLTYLTKLCGVVDSVAIILGYDDSWKLAICFEGDYKFHIYIICFGCEFDIPVPDDIWIHGFDTKMKSKIIMMFVDRLVNQQGLFFKWFSNLREELEHCKIGLLSKFPFYYNIYSDLNVIDHGPLMVTLKQKLLA